MTAGKLRYFALTIVICFTEIANSNPFPACLTNASDTDGDGYGWENDQTCLVDTNSTGPASFTNLETGLTVALLRAYWDAADFDKDMVCATHSFNGAEYQRIDASITGYIFTPISLAPPYVVRVTHSFDSKSAIFPWTVEDGIYNGPGELGRTPWMETIATARGQSAVRIWFLDETFTECSAIDPSNFLQPSGSPPITAECVDLDGDGWGWNGVESCELTPKY